MFLALVLASQIPFRYQGAPAAQNNMPMGNMNNQNKKSEESPKEKLKKAKVFAQNLRSMPEFASVFKAMANLRMLMYVTTYKKKYYSSALLKSVKNLSWIF